MYSVHFWNIFESFTPIFLLIWYLFTNAIHHLSINTFTIPTTSTSPTATPHFSFNHYDQSYSFTLPLRPYIYSPTIHTQFLIHSPTTPIHRYTKPPPPPIFSSFFCTFNYLFYYLFFSPPFSVSRVQLSATGETSKKSGRPMVVTQKFHPSSTPFYFSLSSSTTNLLVYLLFLSVMAVVVLVVSLYYTFKQYKIKRKNLQLAVQQKQREVLQNSDAVENVYFENIINASEKSKAGWVVFNYLLCTTRVVDLIWYSMKFMTGWAEDLLLFSVMYSIGCNRGCFSFISCVRQVEVENFDFILYHGFDNFSFIHRSLLSQKPHFLVVVAMLNSV